MPIHRMFQKYVYKLLEDFCRCGCPAGSGLGFDPVREEICYFSLGLELGVVGQKYNDQILNPSVLYFL